MKITGNFKNVNVVDVHDGDTIFVTFSGVSPVLGKRIGIRLAHINTPELRTTRGKEVASYVGLIINGADTVDLENCHRGKYYRLVCDVIVDGVSMSDHLVENGMAVRYM